MNSEQNQINAEMEEFDKLFSELTIYSRNEYSEKIFYQMYYKWNTLKKMIIQNPRFAYQIIQNKLDFIYKNTDGNISGFKIEIPLSQLIDKKTLNPKVYGTPK